MELLPAGLLNGTPVAGLLCVLFWMLATGRLCTRRELDQNEKRIKALEQALDVRDQQVSTVLTEYLPAAQAALEALHRASDEVMDP